MTEIKKESNKTMEKPVKTSEVAKGNVKVSVADKTAEDDILTPSKDFSYRLKTYIDKMAPNVSQTPESVESNQIYLIDFIEGVLKLPPIVFSSVLGVIINDIKPHCAKGCFSPEYLFRGIKELEDGRKVDPLRIKTFKAMTTLLRSSALMGKNNALEKNLRLEHVLADIHIKEAVSKLTSYFQRSE